MLDQLHAVSRAKVGGGFGPENWRKSTPVSSSRKSLQVPGDQLQRFSGNHSPVYFRHVLHFLDGIYVHGIGDCIARYYRVGQQSRRQVVGGLIRRSFRVRAPGRPEDAIRIVRKILDHPQSFAQRVQREVIAPLKLPQVPQQLLARPGLVPTAVFSESYNTTVTPAGSWPSVFSRFDRCRVPAAPFPGRSGRNDAKDAILWGLPLSRTVKSSCFRSATAHLCCGPRRPLPPAAC